jgi:hypothetical protein
MKIRKSRLKEIIKEEVESSKFIPISETDEPTIMAPGIGNLGQDAMAVLRQVQGFVEKMLEDNEVYGSLVDSALSRLQGIATFHRELRPHINETEPANALLDEIVVQEIVKALSSVNEDEETDEAAEEDSEAMTALATSLDEGPNSHTHQARALQQKAKAQGALGHNDQAALDYHLAQAEKEGK